MGEVPDAWERAAPAGLGWQSAADDPASARRRRHVHLLMTVAGAALLLRLVVGGSGAEPAERIASGGPAGAAVPAGDFATPAPAPTPEPAPAPAAAPPPAPPAAPPTTQPAPPPPPASPPPTHAPPASARVSAAALPHGAAPATVAKSVVPFKGLGTWVDVYDWSVTFTKGQPTVSPDDVDRMAATGVQTLYIQAARADTPEDVLEADRLRAIVDRARSHHMVVVGWFLPYLTDPANDLRHLQAIAAFGFDGVGVDIESTDVKDVNDRNQRLIDLSTQFRSAAPGVPLAAIVLPPVILEVVNPSYWPNFPWREITPFYDVWMPMAYWTNRSQASGYRDAYRYTSENVVRLRNDLGLPAAPVNPIGGIADEGTPGDDDGFLRT